MYKESPESIKSPERIIKFEEETCCALERGFRQNPEVTKELTAIVGESKMANYRNIVLFGIDPKIKAENKFVMSDEIRTVYSQIAKRELERIEAEDEDDGDLLCGHSADEHKEALEGVVGIMEPTIN